MPDRLPTSLQWSITDSIVGAVTSEGTFAGQAAPMEEQLVRRTGQHPDSYLMDGEGRISLLWNEM